MNRRVSSQPDPRPGFAAEPTIDLRDARVAVLGAGSAGAAAAWCLASRGVGRIDLADRDVLAPENLRRHVCARADLGRSKPFAVAEFLEDRFSALRVHHAEFCFLKQPDRLRDLLGGAEIALVAIDSEGPKHLIDAMLWELGRAAVYLGIYGGGWGAEAILVDPARRTPCYGCTAPRLGRTGIVPDGPAAGPSYALAAPSSSETSDPAWRRADLGSILPAAALGARIVTAWLEARRGFDRPLRDLRVGPVTAWRLALRRIPAWDLEPWSVDFVPITRQDDCPLCGPARIRTAPDEIESLLDHRHALLQESRPIDAPPAPSKS
jgi:molybdopterin/thiamine biosynthesis adenylyltransferase